MTNAADSGKHHVAADATAEATPEATAEVIAPATTSASFRVEEMHGRAVVVAAGEIDMTTAPGLRDALAAASHACTRVVLDLSAVTFLDSSGVAVLVDTLREGRQGRPLALSLAGAAHTVRRVLDITRVDRMLPTYDTLAQALDQHV